MNEEQEAREIRRFMDQPRPTEAAKVCRDHGPYRSVNVSMIGVVWSECPTCTKANEIRRHNYFAEKHEIDLERAKAAQESSLVATGIPVRFRATRLEGFDVVTAEQRAVLEFAKDYAHGFDVTMSTGCSAMFVGSTGTGKTMLAIGIARHVHDKGRTVRYATVWQAISRVKDSWAKSATESEAAVVAELAGCDLLVLDEVGIQYGTDFENNLLFSILNERYNNRRPTILISNLNQEGVTKFLGERIIDRMREDGGRVIPFVWPSHRKEMA